MTNILKERAGNAYGRLILALKLMYCNKADHTCYVLLAMGAVCALGAPGGDIQYTTCTVN